MFGVRRQSRLAMTMVEVLISLVVVSLLSLSIAAMLQAVGYGTSARREVRRMAVREQQVRSRFDDAIRYAQEILATNNSSYIVLWRGDENSTDTNKDAINLSELQLIEVVGAGGSATLTCYTVPAPVPDPTYDRSQDLRQIMLNRDDKVQSPWAQRVSGFSVLLDNANPSDACLVTWRLTLTDQDMSETLVSCVSRRSRSSA